MYPDGILSNVEVFANTEVAQFAQEMSDGLLKPTMECCMVAASEEPIDPESRAAAVLRVNSVTLGAVMFLTAMIERAHTDEGRMQVANVIAQLFTHGCGFEMNMSKTNAIVQHAIEKGGFTLSQDKGVLFRAEHDENGLLVIHELPNDGSEIPPIDEDGQIRTH